MNRRALKGAWLLFILLAGFGLLAATAQDKQDKQGKKSDSKKSRSDVEDIGDRDVGKGLNFYSLEKEIALGKALAAQVEQQSRIVQDPVVGEFVIPELLGGPETLMIGKVLWQEFFNNRDWPVASALAVVMLAILIVPIILFNRSQAKEMEGKI